MRKYRLVFSLCILWIPFLLTGQFYSAGTDPARTRWRQIQAGNFTVIYPQEIDSLAKRYAWLLEKAAPHVMEPLQADIPALPVVLRPYTLFSNGMVAWAPKRMELYTTPPAFSYAQSWDKQLVLHETRHAGQMSKLSQHVFKVAGYLIGQQAQGIAAGGYMARWMLEGDAVLSETEYSFSGRGREAAFLMPYKAYLLDSISFHWDTWRYGSYKYYTPNQYQFGYYLLSAIRYRTQAGVLSDIFDMIARRPYIPFINGIAFYKLTGATRSREWEPATELMTAIWNRELLKSGPPTSYEVLADPVLPPKKKPENRHLWKKPASAYANYTSITSSATDSVYALYSSLDRAASLVRIDSGGKKEWLRYVGNLSGDLAQGGGKLYWTEIVPGLRWEHESFSLLRSYNLRTKALTTVTRKSRYLHPSVSPSGQKIAVAYTAVTGQSALHILAAGDGTVMLACAAPDKGQVQSSAWASDSLLYAAVLSDSGLGIYALHTQGGTWRRIVPPQYRTVSRLHYADGLLYFSSDLDGTDNIYALDPHTAPAQLFSLTCARYGAFAPWALGNRLYYADYSYAGLRPVAAFTDSLRWKRADFAQPCTPPVAEELSRQVRFRIDTVPVPENPPYTSKPYRKATSLFRIHSWAPIYYDADHVAAISMDKWYDVASPGAVVFSQNTLGTATTQLGYAYHGGFHAGHLKFTYRGWYPVIELSGDVNDRKAGQNKVEQANGNAIHSAYTVLDNPSLRASAHIYVPFNLQGRGWMRGLVPRIYLTFKNDLYYSIERQSFKHYATLQAGIQYYQYRPMTLRQIFPRWGFGVSVQAVSSPWMGKILGTELFAQVYGYLPGFSPRQGLRLKVAWQRQWMDGKLYYLSNLAAWPRGYDQPFRSQKYTGISADYAIPVWIGDVSWGGVVYLKRLQVLPFADWAQNQNHLSTEQLFSAGTDVLLDFHFLRIGSPISAGIRAAVKGDNTTAFQLLFNVALP